MTSKFDDIRPFDDADLTPVLAKLLENEQLMRTLVAFRFSNWPSFTKPILKVLVKQQLHKKVKTIKNLRQFQTIIEPYMERMLKHTTKGLSFSGLEDLDMTQACLFMSNHRDIALDPALVNWVLHLNKQETVRIAVGDNLLHTDWVADIIRLNKCFIVQRSIKDRRQKLSAAKLLSEYIHYSLKHDKQHIWIAQQEGRAKDGMDLTNPAIISMLCLNKPKDLDFAEYVSSLRIVPVSISYEFDPCDIAKAKELYKAQQEGSYDKPDNEDINSIIKGIKGNKGKVHLHFGKIVGADFDNTKDVAKYVDEQILQGYQTYPTALVAAKILSHQNSVSDPSLNQIAVESEYREAFEYLQSRLSELNKDEQALLLSMYANPTLRT